MSIAIAIALFGIVIYWSVPDAGGRTYEWLRWPMFPLFYLLTCLAVLILPYISVMPRLATYTGSWKSAIMLAVFGFLLSLPIAYVFGIGTALIENAQYDRTVVGQTIGRVDRIALPTLVDQVSSLTEIEDIEAALNDFVRRLNPTRMTPEVMTIRDTASSPSWVDARVSYLASSGEILAQSKLTQPRESDRKPVIVPIEVRLQSGDYKIIGEYRVAQQQSVTDLLMTLAAYGFAGKSVRTQSAWWSACLALIVLCPTISISLGRRAFASLLRTKNEDLFQQALATREELALAEERQREIRSEMLMLEMQADQRTEMGDAAIEQLHNELEAKRCALDEKSLEVSRLRRRYAELEVRKQVLSERLAEHERRARVKEEEAEWIDAQLEELQKRDELLSAREKDVSFQKKQLHSEAKCAARSMLLENVRAIDAFSSRLTPDRRVHQDVIEHDIPRLLEQGVGKERVLEVLSRALAMPESGKWEYIKGSSGVDHSKGGELRVFRDAKTKRLILAMMTADDWHSNESKAIRMLDGRLEPRVRS